MSRTGSRTEHAPALRTKKWNKRVTVGQTELDKTYCFKANAKNMEKYSKRNDKSEFVFVYFVLLYKAMSQCQKPHKSLTTVI